MKQKAVQVLTTLILLPLLCLAACAHEQPIRLRPAIAYGPPERQVVRAAQPARAAPHPSCNDQASRKLTKTRKRELFRQFAEQGQLPAQGQATAQGQVTAQGQSTAQDSQPDDAPPPAKARKPACQTAGH